MSRSPVLVAVPVMVVAVLGLAGCRGAERAALPAPGVSSAPHVSGTAKAADPLADVEATVNVIEHDVDADAGSDSGTGR
jgi:hypothetical protein